MRAAVYRGPGELVVEERPVPGLGPEDVLVAVHFCGVCGSDLHLVLDGWGRPGSTPGHEWSGRVAALGGAVSGFALGDAVVGGPTRRCGECEYCRAGRPSLCAGRPGVGDSLFQGAFAEYVLCHEAELRRVPGGLDLRTAALAEPLAVSLHALTLSGVRPGQRALVTGAGPIGLLVVAALRARGVTEIAVSEPVAGRRARAGRLGATRLLQPDELVAPSLPFQVAEDAVDVAFECSGQPAAMEAALGRLRRAGTLVLVGAGMRRPRFDANRILLNELVVTGAFTYDAGGIEAALALLASGALAADELLEPGEVALGALRAALDGLAAGVIEAKLLVRPREDAP
jgi:2-desacetyl-2-hydroxyethyl bacteriochlorophyllide A dehydrogenase